MPRMLQLGNQYVNADRLYSITASSEMDTVHIVYEAAPGISATATINVDRNVTTPQECAAQLAASLESHCPASGPETR